jgi:beta-lactamase superfamily II metal-dependent hydrolase
MELKMAKLEIFDVEHGACAMLTADTGARMMIDCGQNVKVGWTPAIELKSVGVDELDLLVVTNYDEDHVDGLPELRKSVHIKMLWRSPNVDPDYLIQLKSEDGMGNGIAELIDMAKTYTGPSIDVDFGQVSRSMFFNGPGTFSDENNLSAVVVLEIYGKKVVFTGDMERAGFDMIMGQPGFREAVQNASVLIAPHHGRECSVHKGFLDVVRPYWTIISDKGYMYDTQQTVPTYRQFSRGGNFRNENRHVLTTRRDGTITLWFDEERWGAN